MEIQNNSTLAQYRALLNDVRNANVTLGQAQSRFEDLEEQAGTKKLMTRNLANDANLIRIKAGDMPDFVKESLSNYLKPQSTETTNHSSQPYTAPKVNDSDVNFIGLSMNYSNQSQFSVRTFGEDYQTQGGNGYADLEKHLTRAINDYEETLEVEAVEDKLQSLMQENGMHLNMIQQLNITNNNGTFEVAFNDVMKARQDPSLKNREQDIADLINNNDDLKGSIAKLWGEEMGNMVETTA